MIAKFSAASIRTKSVINQKHKLPSLNPLFAFTNTKKK